MIDSEFPIILSGLLALAFVATAFFTWLIRRYSSPRLLDIPNERSSHSVATPRGGGLAIACVLGAGVAYLWWSGWVREGLALALLGGGGLVALVGWIDDNGHVAARWRALAQAVAAVWAVYWLGGMPSLDVGVMRVPLGEGGFILAVLTVVWFTNLYNFMDGIDGLAGVEAVTVGVIGGALLWVFGDQGLAAVAWLLAAASAGFLVWNWPPARIFMGDVGSGLLGFCFGVLALAGDQSGGVPTPVWGIVLAVFIGDATYTLIKRLLRGERVYAPHRTHAYQRLLRQGCTHREVTLRVALINITVLGGVAAWVITHPRQLPVAVLAVAFGAWWVWKRIQDSGPAEEHPAHDEGVWNRRTAIILHDLAMVGAAWALSYLYRFGFQLNDEHAHGLWVSLPMVVVAQGAILWLSGLYKSMWRYASTPDLWNILRAVVAGAAVAGLLLFVVNRMDTVPRSTLLLYPVFLTFLLGAPRVLYRMWKDQGLTLRRGTLFQRVLIVGAGSSGEMLARDMLRAGDYLPVGFLDDKERIKGAKIQGVPVLGLIEDLQRVAPSVGVDVIVIAMPSADSAQMQRVVRLCEQSGIPFRTVPKIQDLVVGRAHTQQLREVDIEDLLGRDPVALDWQRINTDLSGKTVLVTGGGGSIGAELCRQLAWLGPRALVIFEQSEYNLFAIELALRQRFPNVTVHAVLGDVCDGVAVARAFERHRPDVVFHAAAYKHVPLLEGQVREAVRNNVLGTRLTAAAADEYGCQTFVMISTDKAVNPTNVMGATKRVSELLCQALAARSQTRFITVRFGNVLGSAGSVVPLFHQQIVNGGPVTVTHPDVTRYFMTIPEACQLIMQSSVMGRGGEIFVLEMGAPVKIRALAEQMIRLSGKVPGQDIAIIYTGLRPGEKLYEELFYAQEKLATTPHNKILLAQATAVDAHKLEQFVDAMEHACRDYDEPALRRLLKEVVPQIADAHGEPQTADNVVQFKRG